MARYVPTALREIRQTLEAWRDHARLIYYRAGCSHKVDEVRAYERMIALLKEAEYAQAMRPDKSSDQLINYQMLKEADHAQALRHDKSPDQFSRAQGDKKGV